MKTLSRIRLSDLGQDKKMDPNKLLQLKGGIDISLFAGCTSKVCSENYEGEKDRACEGTDVCRSGAQGSSSGGNTGNNDNIWDTGGTCTSFKNGKP